MKQRDGITLVSPSIISRFILVWTRFAISISEKRGGKGQSDRIHRLVRLVLVVRRRSRESRTMAYRFPNTVTDVMHAKKKEEFWQAQGGSEDRTNERTRAIINVLGVKMK
jgi:hypothetical protein